MITSWEIYNKSSATDEAETRDPNEIGIYFRFNNFVCSIEMIERYSTYRICSSCQIYDTKLFCNVLSEYLLIIFCQAGTSILRNM